MNRVNDEPSDTIRWTDIETKDVPACLNRWKYEPAYLVEGVVNLATRRPHHFQAVGQVDTFTQVTAGTILSPMLMMRDPVSVSLAINNPLPN